MKISLINSNKDVNIEIVYLLCRYTYYKQLISLNVSVDYNANFADNKWPLLDNGHLELVLSLKN